MAAERRDFTLVGNFEDNISKSLKKINSLIDQISGRGKGSKKKNKKGENLFDTRGMVKGLGDVDKALKQVDRQIRLIGRRKLRIDQKGIKAAKSQAKELDGMLRDLAKKTEINVDTGSIRAAKSELEELNRMGIDRLEPEVRTDGIRAAQEEVSLLGEMMKAAGAVELGRGFGNSMTAGFGSLRGMVGRASNFMHARFQDAANDAMQDIQARGSLYGSLTQKEIFGTTKGLEGKELALATRENYNATKTLTRVMERAMGEQIKKSSNPTESIVMYQRQLADNLLPLMFKARGITDLSQYKDPNGKISRAKLEEIMEGEKGVGTELAVLLDQMASVAPSRWEAATSARAYTEYLNTGKVNRRLGVFMNNPVFADALEQNAASAGGDPAKLLEGLKKALEVAMPAMALQEAQRTFSGSMQALSDTFLNASVGLFSFASDIPNQGTRNEKLFADEVEKMQKISRERFDERLETYKNDVVKMEEERKSLDQNNKDEKKQYDKLTAMIDAKRKNIKSMSDSRVDLLKQSDEEIIEMIRSIDSPMEMIGLLVNQVAAPLGDFFSTMKNVFGEPMLFMLKQFLDPFIGINKFITNRTSDMRKFWEDNDLEGKNWAMKEILPEFAKALGEIFAKIFQVFDEGMGNMQDPTSELGKLIDKTIKSFLQGFTAEGIDGKKHMDSLLNGIIEAIKNAFFVNGNFLQPRQFTVELTKILALAMAPAIITTLVTTLFSTMGIIITGVLFEQAPKILSGILKKSAGTAAAASSGGGIFATATTAKVATGVTKAGQTAAYGAGLLKAFAPSLKGIAPLPKSLANLGKVVSKGNAVMALLSIAIRKLSGESWGSAIGGGLSTTIGGVLGGILGAFFGPAAPIMVPLLSIAGAFAGDAIFNTIRGSLDPSAKAQQEAATAQQAMTDVLREQEAQGRKYESDILNTLDSLSEKELARVKTELRTQADSGNKDSATALTAINAATGQLARLHELEGQITATQSRVDQFKQLGADKKLEIEIQKLEGLKAKAATLESDVVETIKKGGLNLSTSISLAAGTIAQSSDVIPAAIRAVAGRLAGIDFAFNLDKRQQGKKRGAVDNTGEKNTGPRGRSGAALASYSGSLGDAVASEMKNKPAGSDLVIANSSETVIPAAGGYGMGDFMSYLQQGFTSNMAATGIVESSTASRFTELASFNAGHFTDVSNANSQYFEKTGEDIAGSREAVMSNLEKAATELIKAEGDSTQSLLQTIQQSAMQSTNVLLQAVQSISMMGGMMGMGAGATGGGYGGAGVALAGALGHFAKANGFDAWRQDEHGGRPTSGHSKNSYHYQGRAIDIPGGPSQHGAINAMIAKFNATHGVSPTEWIDASKDPAGHSDHVHIAYALGQGNPALFKSARDADHWEARMAKGNPIISSVRAQAHEVGGGPTTNHITIHINQQPGQNPQELARLVAHEIGRSVEEQRGRTIL